MNAHLKGLQAFQERLELYGDDIAMWEINEALQAYLEASGMVMVPREPTEEMVMTQGKSRPSSAPSEQSRQIAERLNRSTRQLAVLTYKEMIEAFPSPFSQANTEGEGKP